jgi:hypothetical protein
MSKSGGRAQPAGVKWRKRRLSSLPAGLVGRLQDAATGRRWPSMLPQWMPSRRSKNAEFIIAGKAGIEGSEDEAVALGVRLRGTQT